MKTKYLNSLFIILLFFSSITTNSYAVEKFFNVKQKCSFNLKNTPLPDFLRLVARSYGVNLFYKNLKNENISISIENVTVNELLDFIIKDNNLDYIKSGNIVKVFPKKKIIEEQLEINKLKGKKLFDIVAKNVFLGKLLRQVSSKKLCNATCSSDIFNNRISVVATNINTDTFMKLIASQENYSLTNDNGFYFFSQSKEKKQEVKGRVIKISSDEETGLIKINVSNAPLNIVCEKLFNFTPCSFVLLDSLKDNVTAKIEEHDFDKLLALLFKGTNSAWFKEKNVYYLGTKNSKLMEHNEVVELKHIDLKVAINAIPDDIKKHLTIKEIAVLNSLLVSGNTSKINKLKDIIAKIDHPVAQVLIEVLVVDFKRNDNSQLGINISNGENSFFPGIDLNLEANKDSTGHWQVSKLPSNFMLQIHALAEQGVARIISKPHIATLNGQEASIKVGERLFYKVKTEINQGELSPITRTTEQIKEIEASISLKIKPYVTAGGEISVEIQPDFNSFLGDVVDNVPPPINYRNLKSTVRLKDGETIILGGLIQEIISRKYQGVPWISKLPIIGHLFKNHDKEKTNAELVMYITPHIYYGNEGSIEIIKHDEGLSYNLDVKSKGEKELKNKQKDKKKNENFYDNEDEDDDDW